MAMARAVLAILLALTAGCANPPRPAPPSTAPAYVWVTFDESTLLNSGASGLADRRTGRPLTIYDPVRLASIPQLVFAVGAVRLVAQGVLDPARDESDRWGW